MVFHLNNGLRMESKLLSGKVCLVTGAGKGIGRAVAELFASHGAIVYATVRNQEHSGRLMETGSILPMLMDVTDSEAVRDGILRIKKEQKRLDALVNNAALVTYEPLGMASKNTMRDMFEVNVFAMIELMQYASRIMTRQKSGSIVNMASIVGVKGAAGQLIYSASKGAVIAATKSAAKEFAQYGVRVNAVAPGMVDTERFSAEMSQRFSDKVDSIRMGRLAEPKEIAETCLYLASDMSKYVTGQIIGVDGSITL